MVRLALFEAGVPFVEIPPSSLKKLATGKGNAGKELVLVEAVKRLGYTGSDNNEADALWLHQLAMHALDLPGAVELPKAHRAALDPERWAAALEALERPKAKARMKAGKEPGENFTQGPTGKTRDIVGEAVDEPDAEPAPEQPTLPMEVGR